MNNIHWGCKTMNFNETPYFLMILKLWGFDLEKGTNSPRPAPSRSHLLNCQWYLGSLNKDTENDVIKIIIIIVIIIIIMMLVRQLIRLYLMYNKIHRMTSSYKFCDNLN